MHHPWESSQQNFSVFLRFGTHLNLQVSEAGESSNDLTPIPLIRCCCFVSLYNTITHVWINQGEEDLENQKAKELHNVKTFDFTIADEDLKFALWRSAFCTALARAHKSGNVSDIYPVFFS